MAAGLLERYAKRIKPISPVALVEVGFIYCYMLFCIQNDYYVY